MGWAEDPPPPFLHPEHSPRTPAPPLPPHPRILPPSRTWGSGCRFAHRYAGRTPPPTREGLGGAPKDRGLCEPRAWAGACLRGPWRGWPRPPQHSGCVPRILSAPRLRPGTPARAAFSPIIGPRVRGGGGGARTWRHPRWEEGCSTSWLNLPLPPPPPSPRSHHRPDVFAASIWGLLSRCRRRRREEPGGAGRPVLRGLAGTAALLPPSAAGTCPCPLPQPLTPGPAPRQPSGPWCSDGWGSCPPPGRTRGRPSSLTDNTPLGLPSSFTPHPLSLGVCGPVGVWPQFPLR